MFIFIAFRLDKNTECSHDSEVKVSLELNCGLSSGSMNLMEREKERSWTSQPQNFVHILEIFLFLSPQILDSANTHLETHTQLFV